MKSNSQFFVVIMLLLVGFFSPSCLQKGDRVKAQKMQTDTIYPEIATGVQVNVTDSGRRIAQINSPLMERYAGKEPYIEMRKGLQGLFFDKQGVKQNQLDANYGISYEKTKVIEVRNNVRLENVKGDKLTTEKLTWDQASKKIYTDQFVKIATQNEVIYGQGFESNETFTVYRIFKTEGVFSIKKILQDTAPKIDSANVAPQSY